ncbi:MAG TPA: tyrosine--tRNA ligase [Kofleriaceae bacterium]|jgi:tyrosyl-tRNA synthetase
MLLLDELDARGLLANCTDRAGLAELLASHAPIAAYAGYDPTAPSLHVGNLVPSILLKRLQLAGHKPIVVVGGATGMIGDPSGKSEERNLLDDATLAANVAGIRAQLSRQLEFDTSPTGASLVNNHDWTVGITYLEFLRDIGKYLTVNYMTAKDSVSSRLQGDNGISYTEFSYMLLQAYDFVHLAESHGCRLQVGGNDQYGNITAGCELQRKLGRPQLFGWTAPLLLDSTGQKMGKTTTGERIWLDPARTTPFAFYQYWLNTADADAPRFLRMFSLESLARIDELIAAHEADRAKRIAQRELARVMTSWVHGADAIAGIEAASGEIFGGDLSKLGDAELEAMAGTVPSVDVPRGELEAGIPLIDLLVRTGLEDSKGAARRQISQGGASVNNVVITDIAKKVVVADLLTPTRLVLRKGRKHYRIVRAV